MATPLWKAESGEFAGWRNGNDLHDADGESIGYFDGDIAYSNDGEHLGEMKGERIGKRMLGRVGLGRARLPAGRLLLARPMNKPPQLASGWEDPDF